MAARKAPDWRQRFGKVPPPHVVMLSSRFAGLQPGSQMLISSPAEIAAYLATIPRGDIRSIARLRSDLARRAGADAVCPVTTSIYLRIVAEVALADLASGQALVEVAPFWRVLSARDKIAAKLSCGAEAVDHYRRLDEAAEKT